MNTKKLPPITNDDLKYWSRSSSTTIDKYLNAIQERCLNNLHDAKKAAQLMQLQLDINNYIQNREIDDSKIKIFEKEYETIRNQLKPVKFSWFQQEANEKPFTGNVSQYINYRSKKQQITMQPKPLESISTQTLTSTSSTNNPSTAHYTPPQLPPGHRLLTTSFDTKSSTPKQTNSPDTVVSQKMPPPPPKLS